MLGCGPSGPTEAGAGGGGGAAGTGGGTPEWSCPTCLAPVGRKCFVGSACPKTAADEPLYCNLEFRDLFNGICAPSCLMDSECGSAAVGASGWKCCTTAIGFKQTGWCAPPEWTCGAPELYSTWVPKSPHFLVVDGFQKLDETLEFRPDATMSLTLTSEGVPGGKRNGCRRVRVDDGTFIASVSRNLKAAEGKLTLTWTKIVDTLTDCTGPDLDGATTAPSTLKNISDEEWSIDPRMAGKVLQLEPVPPHFTLNGSWTVRK